MNTHTSPAVPRTALVVGHPGHELRLLGWALRERPHVAVLTDGSGHGAESRIAQTTEILAAAGCARSPVYGAVTDGDVYAAILRGDATFFVDLAQRLADWLVAESVSSVVSDGVEGYNPTHDLCAAVAARAARLAAKASNIKITHYTFPLVGPALPDPVPADAVLVVLDESGLAEKLALSRQYAARAGGILVREVEDMIATLGAESFAREMLAPADLARDFAPFADAAPFYETHGERQVAAGHYRYVIRYAEHIAPLLRALAA